MTEGEVYQGRSYFLEILPSSEVEVGQEYPIAIGVQSRSESGTNRIYLPMILKLQR